MSQARDLSHDIPDLRATLDRRAVDQWLARNGLTLEQVQAPGNRPDMVEARRSIARFLRRSDWSFPMIGDLLHRDHSSIMNLLAPRVR